MNKKIRVSIYLAIGFGITTNSYADDASKQIQMLNQQLQSQLQQVQETQQKQLNDLNKQLQTQVKQVQTDLQAQIQKVNEQMKQMQTDLQAQIKQLQVNTVKG
ncbi:MAG: hypothetical protein Q8R83_07660 [Legionellaceae bacterium]|nr:hypothetical protein [Legionellaceae bacterium]